MRDGRSNSPETRSGIGRDQRRRVLSRDLEDEKRGLVLELLTIGEDVPKNKPSSKYSLFMTGTFVSLSFEIIPAISSEQCYKAKHAICDPVTLFCVKGQTKRVS